MTIINRLYVSQTSPVVLCMQNNVISVRYASIHRSQPLLEVFVSKTATFGLELQVSMGPRLHLWLFAFKTATLAPELQVSMGPSPHLLFCAFTTATLTQVLIVSMGPRPSPVVLYMQNRVICTRITSLYGSHPSFVDFACKTATLALELQVSTGPSPHLWFCAFTTATL